MGREPAPPARAAGDDGSSGEEALYRLAFEQAPDAIVVAQEGRIQLANPAAERLAARGRSELVGLSFADLIHPEDLSGLLERYQRRLSGTPSDSIYQFRIIDGTGETRFVAGHSYPSSWRGKSAVLTFLTEVTERERERREAAQLERMLTRIAELSPYFIFVYDYEQGRDVYINRPVPAALGYSELAAQSLEPYPFQKLCHPDDYLQAIDRDARWMHVPDGAIDVVEFRMKNAAGEWRWFRSINTPFLRESSGRVVQMLGVSIDVTDQKRADEALRRSERLEGIGLLAGGLAHDFGNLLTPVLGHAELILRRLPDDSPLRTRVETIRTAAERAGELVRQLLVVSGRGAFEPRPVDLGDLIAEAAALVEPVLPSDVTLETEIVPHLPPVAGDASQLRQVIMNLISNARDALSGRGGSIVVRALPVDVDDTQASVLELREKMALGPAVLLEVEDDGPGMDATTRARLLEPFFTTKPTGRGMGLASVVGIVRRHRGGLAVDSNPGRGTIFRILLPLAAPHVEQAAIAG